MRQLTEAEIETVLQKHPLLKFLPPNVFEGQISLVINGEVYHTFELVIQVNSNHPYGFPSVWETGGDIPRVVDRHVFPKTGNLCFGVKAEESILCSNGIKLCWFLDRVLMPRLADEYCVMHGGEYKREKSHGVNGDWEFYAKELKTSDPTLIVHLLLLLKYNSLPKSLETCPCGSNEPYVQCHAIHMTRIVSSFQRGNRSFWEGQLDRLIKSRKWSPL